MAPQKKRNRYFLGQARICILDWKKLLVNIKFVGGPKNDRELDVPHYMPKEIIFPATMKTYDFYELDTKTNFYIYVGEKELGEQK